VLNAHPGLRIDMALPLESAPANAEAAVPATAARVSGGVHA
jgi:hypothetical protein